jgi:endonuclease YncB( thermonuclease family)
MKRLTRVAALLALAAVCALFAGAQQPASVSSPQSPVVTANNIQLVIEGKVINVHDGDTVTVLDQNNKKFHIRLQGIDAPELKQEFGDVSQENLSRMVLGKDVTIVWTKLDKYRRTVGTIMLNGHDVNIEQVRAGMAWHFKKYEDEQSPADRRTYAAAEQQARAAKLGLWKQADPMQPGEWRQEVKIKRWGPPPPEGTVIGNRNSKKYHRPDCPGYHDMAEKNRVFFKSVEEAEAAGYKRAGNCPAQPIVITHSTDSTNVAAPHP